MKTAIKVLVLLGLAGGIGYYVYNREPATEGDQKFLPQEKITQEEETEFNRFIAGFRRSYATRAEYNVRLGYFAKEYRNIKALNARAKGSATWGINKFSDYTE